MYNTIFLTLEQEQYATHNKSVKAERCPLTSSLMVKILRINLQVEDGNKRSTLVTTYEKMSQSLL